MQADASAHIRYQPCQPNHAEHPDEADEDAEVEDEELLLEEPVDEEAELEDEELSRSDAVDLA